MIHSEVWAKLSTIADVSLKIFHVDRFVVTLGAVLGHSMCTGLAVVGGKFLASRISEKTVTIVGGVLFLMFALHSFVAGPDQ
jgi:putative Ca2+/H+ antiporter (TMEM165/GDT1 family)